MLALRRGEQLHVRLLDACRRYLATQNLPKVSGAADSDSEFTAEPVYPEIKDLSFRARKEREDAAWHEEIRDVPTVEEKLIKINMPRYWGYRVVELSDGKLPYNSLPAVQHYTRTVFEELKLEDPSPSQEHKLPAKSSGQLDSLSEAVQGNVVDGIEFAYDFFRRKYPQSDNMDPVERENKLAQLILEQINRDLINSLSVDYPHLSDIEVDYNPRHEAFWFVGGINPPKNVVKSKEGHKWQKDMAHDSVNRLMQYAGRPYLALRHKLQLLPWKTAAESENLEIAKQVPQYRYDPRSLGWVTSHRHGTNIPGFWPGNPNGFGLVSYQSRALLNIPPALSYGSEDVKETLHALAIQSSYAWLSALANYNGFNTFTELTYPMNTQTIISNGRDFSFYEYQLNTLLVHSRHVDENPRVNFCRGTGEVQLYQEVDANGKCIGFNDTVLKHLLKFYINAPTVERPQAELQPYLSEDAHYIADYNNEEKRSFLERTFKHMCANRPRYLEQPEIYLWEKIYKIDNKTRALEPKRRFFELGINPWKRTLDQHQKEYIPRALRAEGPKSKKKWKPSFYP